MARVDPKELYESMLSKTGQELQRVLSEKGLSSCLLQYANKLGFPYREVIEQWHFRRSSQSKFPSLLKRMPHWIFPSSQSIEQATPEAVAIRKSKAFSGNTVLDMTGGLGIDFLFLAKRAEKAVYVEQNTWLAEVARWNFRDLNQVEVICGDAKDALEDLNIELDLLYVDPDRRVKGQRTFLPEESSPNIAALWPLMRKKAKHIWIKMSPMVDITSLTKSFPDYSEIEVWALQRDVKELLLRFAPRIGAQQIHTHHILHGDTVERFDARVEDIHVPAQTSGVEVFIYEPNPAVMKLGAWRKLAQDFELKMLDTHTHMFTGASYRDDFPGKVWRVEKMGKPGDKSLLNPNGMHIISRNFPQKAEDIRRKYRIPEGETLLLACSVGGDKYWITGRPQLTSR